MPYNTRRKSLSLPSLGIHVPVTHAARAAAAKPPQTSSSTTTASSRPQTSRGASPASASTSTSASTTHRHPSQSTLSAAASMSPSSASSPKRSSPSDDSPAHHQNPPSKRTKRAHGADSLSPSTKSKSSSSSPTGAKHSAAASTPPPSPKPLRQASVEMDAPDTDIDDVEIDMDAVNDDIVEAVILQLQATGNRPHLIKELSAILMLQLKSVQQSANPCAIISSRLATYMKRPCWSASATCPLTKELEAVHPRRTYYFLATCPHLPLSEASATHFVVPRASIVTPPLSSAASGSEAAEEERRRELSPSPEVDLSSPEFDDFDDDIPMPGTPIGSFSSRYSRYARYPRASSGPYVSSRSHRGASPPLEKDEKEFTQTAEGLQKRKLAGSAFSLSSAASATLSSPPSTGSNTHSHGMDLDDAGRDESLLFGSELRHLAAATGASAFALLTSPTMRPAFSALGPKRESESDSWAKLDTMLDWDRNPENIELETIELDDLDGLLDEF